jgi:hypothetical protein
MVPESAMASTMRQLPPLLHWAAGGGKAGLKPALAREDVWEVMMASSVNHFMHQYSSIPLTITLRSTIKLNHEHRARPAS